MELRIEHRYCDPDAEERKAAGIEEPGDTEAKGWQRHLSREEIDAIRAENDRKRERIWFDRLREISSFPILFVCGGNHVAPFAALLNAEGYRTTVMAESWRGANPSPNVD